MFFSVCFIFWLTNLKAQTENDISIRFNSLPDNNIPTAQYYNDLYDHMNNWLIDPNLNPIFQQELNNANFKTEFQSNLLLFTQFAQYLDGYPVNGPELQALGLSDLINVLVYAIEIAEKSVALEGKLGLSASGHVKAGEGVTVRLALGGELALMDHLQLVEKNEYPNLADGDIYKPFVEVIKNNIDESVSQAGDHPQEDGIHKALENVQSIAKFK